MGFRTLVLLYNDHASEWEKDPELGRKIAVGMNSVHDKDYASLANLRYGKVVECAHADTQTVAVLDSYSFTSVAHSFWRQGETTEDRNVRLLKEMADKLGYNISKKPQRRSGIE